MENDVRIYALKDPDFSSEEVVRDYFVNILPNSCNIFRFRKRGIVCREGDVIYFQFEKYIVAKATVKLRLGLSLHLEAGSVQLARRKVLTSELGVMWLPQKDQPSKYLLKTHVQRGPLFIRRTDAAIIDAKCF